MLKPAIIPEITDEKKAKENPELAVFSAIAHSQDKDTAKVLEIAWTAQKASAMLAAERTTFYFDSVLHALPKLARQMLQQMMQAAKFEYRSEFVKRFVAQGEAKGLVKGETRGRAALSLKLQPFQGDQTTRPAAMTREVATCF